MYIWPALKGEIPLLSKVSDHIASSSLLYQCCQIVTVQHSVVPEATLKCVTSWRAMTRQSFKLMRQKGTAFACCHSLLFLRIFWEYSVHCQVIMELHRQRHCVAITLWFPFSSRSVQFLITFANKNHPVWREICIHLHLYNRVAQGVWKWSWSEKTISFIQLMSGSGASFLP